MIYYNSKNKIYSGNRTQFRKKNIIIKKKNINRKLKNEFKDLFKLLSNTCL